MKIKSMILALILGLGLASQTLAAGSGNFTNQSLDYESLGYTYANRPTFAGTTSSKFFWCRDCVIAPVCAAGGAGTWAWWGTVDSAWHCAGTLPTNLLTTTTAFAGDVTGVYSATVVGGWNSILLDSTFAAPTDGYIPTYSAGLGKWTTSNNAVVTGLVYNHNAYASSVAVGSGSPTTLLTTALTMPATGCPCRVLVDWNIFGTAGGALQVGAWVSDGVSAFSGGESDTMANTNNGGFASSGASTVTYANNAAVTLTLQIQTSASTYTAKSSSPISGNISTYLDAMVVASN